MDAKKKFDFINAKAKARNLRLEKTWDVLKHPMGYTAIKKSRVDEMLQKVKGGEA